VSAALIVAAFLGLSGCSGSQGTNANHEPWSRYTPLRQDAQRTASLEKDLRERIGETQIDR